MLTVKANFRKIKKTAESRRLRQKNKCPAIIYKNAKSMNIAISLNHNDIQHPKILSQFYKKQVIKIIINQKETFIVKIQDIQYHPFKLKITHIDFLLI